MLECALNSTLYPMFDNYIAFYYTCMSSDSIKNDEIINYYYNFWLTKLKLTECTITDRNQRSTDIKTQNWISDR